MKHSTSLAVAAALALAGCQTTTGNIATMNVPPNSTISVGTFPDFQNQLNSARSGPGLNPLSYNAKLAAAAQVHADDMSTNGFFSHDGSDGSKFFERIAAQGYNYAWAAENIAVGYTTEAAVFTAWMNSPGHRANMLSAEPTEFGLAWADGNYWVLELARPN